MHPYFLASIVVSVAVVAYVVYTVYQEPQPIFVEGGGEKYNEKPQENRSDDGDEDSLDNSDEKSGLRRRKKSKDVNSQQSSNMREHSDYDEQELLDRLSYLNAVEQEIERKKLQLADEERILGEKEREIEQRKQSLLESSLSSSISELGNLSTGTTFHNISNTSTSTNNIVEIPHEQPLIEVSSPISLVSRLPSTKTINSSLNDEHDNESHTFSDSAANTILTQDLSRISHQQMTPVVNYPLATVNSPNSTISSQHNQDDSVRQSPNQSHLTVKSARSDDAWSEIESVLSENIGSIMSSAVDIDMEDVDVIEH
ncbi:12238_t:CDS:2 [Acaulospora morrowiae]|uniref:12238_t:CDS:1 n=1 Tax=Acaulospora morrowiae TaxID=94023 RepID=A0A9N8WQH7_9GLOM|nr:12238_t:CDS:2 [Acaulospora morrowiae]